MRRVVATVLAAALFALPACGGKTDEKTRAAGITPPDALGFVSVNLDPSIEQKRNLLDIVRRFPDARDEVKDEFDESRDELLAELLEDTGLDFERDVKPWLGNEVALAVLPPLAAGKDPLILAMVETDDTDEAKAALEKAGKSGEFDAAYGVIDNFVVISDQEDDADEQPALDGIAAQAEKDDGGLADAPAFEQVVDELHGDRLFLGWVDLKDSLDEIDRAGGLEGLEFADRFTNQAGPLGFDLHAEKGALVFQGVAAATGGSEGGDAELTRSLPEATLAALTLFDIGDGVREGLTALAGGEGPDVLEELEREVGLDLENDVLSWVDGELVFVVGDVPESQPFPNFALVVKPSDRAKAREGVTRIRDALAARGLTLEEREVAGATAYLVPEPFFDRFQPAMALFPDRFVLASHPDHLEDLARASSPGLGDADAYKAVLGDDSERTTVQFVALIDPIREALERALLDDPEDKAEYERDTKPNVEPLSAFGIVARRDGDVHRFEMKLTFD